MWENALVDALVGHAMPRSMRVSKQNEESESYKPAANRRKGRSSDSSLRKDLSVNSTTFHAYSFAGVCVCFTFLQPAASFSPARVGVFCILATSRLLLPLEETITHTHRAAEDALLAFGHCNGALSRGLLGR